MSQLGVVVCAWLVVMILILDHGLAAVLIAFALIAGVALLVVGIRKLMKNVNHSI